MKKILIVEDNSDYREIMNLFITKMGYRAITAKNSYEAITFAETEGPDLIFMDMQLPDVDGVNTTAMLKQNPKTSRIPVVALTAWMSALGEAIPGTFTSGSEINPIASIANSRSSAWIMGSGTGWRGGGGLVGKGSPSGIVIPLGARESGAAGFAPGGSGGTLTDSGVTGGLMYDGEAGAWAYAVAASSRSNAITANSLKIGIFMNNLLESSTRQCRIFKLAAEPKRWISVTAPVLAAVRFSPACGMLGFEDSAQPTALLPA
jgi:Response regulator receiver domain